MIVMYLATWETEGFSFVSCRVLWDSFNTYAILFVKDGHSAMF